MVPPSILYDSFREWMTTLREHGVRSAQQAAYRGGHRPFVIWSASRPILEPPCPNFFRVPCGFHKYLFMIAALRYKGKIYPGYNSHAKAYNALLEDHPTFNIKLEHIVLEELATCIIEYGYTDMDTKGVDAIFYTREQWLNYNDQFK